LRNFDLEIEASNLAAARPFRHQLGFGWNFSSGHGMKATVVLCLILMMTPCPFGKGIPPSSQSLKAQAIAARDGDGWLKMADQAHFGLLKLRDDVSSRGGALCCFYFLTRKPSSSSLLLL